jgi:hypothetical protein
VSETPYPPLSAPPSVPADTTPPEPAAAPTAAPAAPSQPAQMQPQLGGAPLPPELAYQAENQTGYVCAEPLLMVGAHGAAVAELAHLLDDHGYPNKVAQGVAQPVLDDELIRVVQAFQDDNGIAPHKPQDGAPPLVPGRDRHSGIVDAATWVALRDGERREIVIRYPEGSFA